ncbi:MAG: hypothetical protein H7Y31_02575 [Chitinophagaceae bacterium]|nr:hypothetical protein [Chitinophagaceae bacterium]
MRASTIQEIKSEFNSLKAPALVELCLRLAKFKKENKELLTYLLFESSDETHFVKELKTEMQELFEGINKTNIYFAKKSLRKIVRLINKYSRYSGVKETEVELRLHFCVLLRESGIPVYKNTLIKNIFESQVKKCRAILETLHEDIQYDYLRLLNATIASIK